MIFVTVGMHHQGFERLIRGMDELAQRSGERVVMQIGASFYQPAHAEWFRFDEQARIEELSASASVIVSHAGAGTIISAFHHDQPLVVVPRLSGQDEHVDDHQLELARALSEQGKIVSVEDPTADALARAIDQAKGHRPRQQQGRRLASAISTLLQQEDEPAALQPVAGGRR